jgi:hypothetical protein
MDRKRPRRSKRLLAAAASRLPPQTLDQHSDACLYIAALLDYRDLWAFSATCRSIRAWVWTKERVAAFVNEATMATIVGIADLVSLTPFDFEYGMCLDAGTPRCASFSIEETEENDMWCVATGVDEYRVDDATGTVRVPLPKLNREIVVCAVCVDDAGYRRGRMNYTHWHGNPCEACVPPRRRIRRSDFVGVIHHLIFDYGCRLTTHMHATIARIVRMEYPGLAECEKNCETYGFDTIMAKMTHERMMDLSVGL